MDDHDLVVLAPCGAVHVSVHEVDCRSERDGNPAFGLPIFRHPGQAEDRRSSAARLDRRSRSIPAGCPSLIHSISSQSEQYRTEIGSPA
jgi:hypothetical protein